MCPSPSIADSDDTLVGDYLRCLRSRERALLRRCLDCKPGDRGKWRGREGVVGVVRWREAMAVDGAKVGEL